jgi:hypothetical protein
MTWDLRVVKTSSKFKAMVRIDKIYYIGNEGESMIGDPRDFGSYRDVEEALSNINRHAYDPPDSH